jgi:hypothetical protein
MDKVESTQRQAENDHSKTGKKAERLRPMAKAGSGRELKVPRWIPKP